VTWKWREADTEKRAAQYQEQAARDQEKAAQYQAYRASLAAASAALENHDVDAARHLLDHNSVPEALRGWEWRHLRSRLDDSSAVVPLPPGDSAVLLAARDGIRVGVVNSAGWRITDLHGGAQQTVPFGSEHGGYGSEATLTRLGLRITARVGNTGFDLLDDAGRVLCRIRLKTDRFREVVVSPDGTRLGVDVVEGGQGGIAVFDVASGQRTALCAGHSDAVWAYTFSPDSSRLASVSEDKTARIWDAATGELLATCRGHTSKVLSAAFRPDGARLVTASADGTVRQWDARTGREVEPPYDRHANEVYTAVYSPDGQWVASAGFDRTIRVWRATGRQDVAVLHGHTGPVFQVAFAADGRRLASLGWRSAITAVGDKTVRVWEVDPRATLPVLRGHTNYVYPIAFSPDGRWLASGSWDKTVRLWDAATGEPCATLPHPNYVLDLAFGPDGTWLITGCYGEDRLRIWDAATGRVRQTIPLLDKGFSTLAVSPDGTRVAGTVFDEIRYQRRLHVYDIATGKSLFSTVGAARAYSPDGRWLAAVAADDKTVLLRDARTYETRAEFRGHKGLVDKAAFSPDSRWLASCSRDHTVRLWEIASGEGRVPEHTDEVFAVAFHPKDKRLATAGRDGAVWLWDLARDEAVARLPGHKSYVWSLAFSPDGRTLASGSGDGTVRLWDTAPLKTRYDARRAAAALRPEANRLVEKLWREKKDPAEVVQALRADRGLSDALRQAALRAVLRRVQLVDWLLSRGFLL
jgi:WD40 repeat protein